MLSMLREIRSNLMIPKGIRDFVALALQSLATAHNSIIKAHVFETCNANQYRSASPDIQKGMLVYLLTKNLTLSKRRARKLCSKWVGPYKVLEVYKETIIHL